MATRDRTPTTTTAESAATCATAPASIEMDEFVIVVEWAWKLPPVPRHIAVSTVRLLAVNDVDAQLLACLMVLCRPACLMPTRTTIVEVRI